MAHVDNLICTRTRNLLSNADQSILVEELDMGLFNIAKMVDGIRDLVLYPIDSEVDVDGVGAATSSLLAYLGQLGPVIDALGRLPQNASQSGFERSALTTPAGNRQ